MEQRLPKLIAVLSLAIASQTALSDAQGSRQKGYTSSAPFAELSHRPNGAPSLGSIDDSVSLTVEQDVTAQVDTWQSGSTGLDQVQSSRPGGKMSALASSGAIPNGRPTRPVPSQSPARSMNIGGQGLPAQSAAGLSLLSQGAATGISPNALATPRLSATARRSTVYKRNRVAPTSYIHRQTAARNAGSSFLQDNQTNSFERLQDPFFAASRANFEGFTKVYEFERACGGACNLRVKGPGEPDRSDSRRERQLPDIPEAQMPETEGVYGKGPTLPGEPIPSLPTAPN